MSTFKHILSFDPAICVEKSELAKYMTDGNCDPKHLVFLEGSKPMIWHLKKLTREEIKTVRNAGSSSDSCEAAFKRGLVKVENLRMPNGEIKDWYKQDDKSIIIDKVIEAYFSESQVQEIGAIIWQKSVLMVGSTAPYVLPPTSGLEVKGLLRLSVERLKTLSNLEADKAKHKETLNQKSSASGEQPMVATVEVNQTPQKEQEQTTP